MPLLGAVQTPTCLSSGDKLRVLNAEDMAQGDLTMAVTLSPQPLNSTLGIYNNTTSVLNLMASPDLVADHFLPIYDGVVGAGISVAPGNILSAQFHSGLYYALQAASALTAGTIWLAR
jgi:hypothetical protein